MKPALFIPNPHVRLDRPRGTPYAPIESLSVMAVAEQAGMTTRLFDVNQSIVEGTLAVEPAMWGKAAALAAALDPCLVVMETWTDTFHHTVLLLRALRGLRPDLPILFLGAGTSALAEETLLALPEVDAVIRGEGEPAMAVLARWEPSRCLPRAPGLVRRTAAGVESAELAFVDDLDALPRPALHRSFLRPGDSVPVESGRGCDVGCSFCALAGHWSRHYRARPADSLAREMVDVGRRYPGSVIDLCQDARFFADRARVAELCRCLKAHAARPRFTCHARVDVLNSDTLAAMAEAGCCGILFGVESGCPDMQIRIGKRLDLSRTRRVLAAATHVGIAARATFIVGFPGETPASLERTAELVLQARKAGAQTAVQILRAQPGTPSFDADAAKLAFEPLLGVASPDDNEALALIARLPRLHAASYRVVDALPRGQVLAAWLALTVFVEPLSALIRYGAEMDRLLAELFVGDGNDTLEAAAAAVARQLKDHARRECYVDLVAFEDGLLYRMAIANVGRRVEGPAVAFDASAWARLFAEPDRAYPLATAPFESVAVWTPLPRLLTGDLAPSPHPEPIHLIVAKLVAPAGPSFFTRQAATVETFTVGRLASLLLPLCDGRRPLHAIAEDLATQVNQSAEDVLAACVSALTTFGKAGVVDITRRT
jgi:tRNA A37 methylthiotransferase MiaB